MSTSIPLARGGAFLLHPAGSLPQFTPEELGADHREFARAARDFVEGEVLPRDAEIEKLDIPLTVDLLRKAGEIGLLAIEIPEAYEGLDLDKKSTLLVLEEVAKQSSFSTSFSAHTGIGTLPFVYFGSPEQKRKYLPKLATGEWLAAYALTESGSGSDAMGARTTAVLEGEEWVLNGSKMFITNSGFADVFVVFAKVDGRKFSAFIVERNDPGFSVGPEEHKLGIKGSSTCPLSLDNVRIPKDRLLGQVGKGPRVAFGILAIGRFKLGGACMGMAKRVLGYTLRYAAERSQFGRSLNSFGLIRQKLAEMAARIFVGESLNWRTVSYMDEAMGSVGWEEEDAAGRKMEAMEEFSLEASISKIWGSEALFFVADEAVQAFGGYGFSQEYPPEKIYRDCRINRIFEGTNEINRLIIGGGLVKRAASGALPLLPAFEAARRGSALPAFDGPLAAPMRRLEASKRQALLAIGQAQALLGAKLNDNQDALGLIADLASELFAAESGLVRAERMVLAGHRWKDLARDCAELYLHFAQGRIATASRALLAEVLEGEALEAGLQELASLDRAPETPPSRLRDRIATVLVDQGKYPIDLI
ncbi:MAG: acyl-CoA dehydrogenase family protein [Acidobacteria bacterium]|nr:acyl-CoA dehydrogenase family protein [Acidobacteriota bacterium]